MKYHAPTDQFTLEAKYIREASHKLRWAIQKIREGHGLDLAGYPEPRNLQDPHFAEIAIIDAARALGIDLGADRPGKLDVRDSG